MGKGKVRSANCCIIKGDNQSGEVIFLFGLFLIMVFIFHLFLFGLLLIDQSLLLAYPSLASHIEKNYHDHNKYKEDDGPHDYEPLQSTSQHPEKEADHYPKCRSNYGDNDDRVEDHFSD